MRLPFHFPRLFVPLLRRVVNLLVSGKVPLEASLFMAGGSLTALSKLKPGCAPDIRPIVVGEVLRRLLHLPAAVLEVFHVLVTKALASSRRQYDPH